MSDDTGAEFDRWYAEDPRERLFHSSEVIEVDRGDGVPVLGWVHTKHGEFVHIDPPETDDVSEDDVWPADWRWRICEEAITVDEFIARAVV